MTSVAAPLPERDSIPLGRPETLRALLRTAAAAQTLVIFSHEVSLAILGKDARSPYFVYLRMDRGRGTSIAAACEHALRQLHHSAETSPLLRDASGSCVDRRVADIQLDRDRAPTNWTSAVPALTLALRAPGSALTYRPFHHLPWRSRQFASGEVIRDHDTYADAVHHLACGAARPR